MKNKFCSYLLVAALFFMSGCKVASDVEPGIPVTLVSLSITPVNSSIAPGTTRQFTCTGTFSNHRQQNLTSSVTWDSSDAGIATISNIAGSIGLATAGMNIGSAVISAVSGTVSGTTIVTTSPVAAIEVMPPTSSSIAPGTSLQFIAIGTLSDSTTQNLTTYATWTTLDAGIVAISDAPGSKGLATAVAPGSATISATYGAIGTATLSSSPLVSIAVAPPSANITTGTTQQFTATGTLLDGAIQSLTTYATWTSSNTGVAVISNTAGSKGLATAVAVGTSNITAQFSAITSNPAALTVTSPVLVSIAVTPVNPNIPLGETQQFVAIGTFSDTTTQDISSSATWSSSNTSVATISNISGSKGLATSLGVGSTNITASFSGKTSNIATLNITAAQLVSIAVTPASADIVVGATRQFSAMGTFTDNSMQDLTTSVNWASTDTTIATISNAPGSRGLATAFYKAGPTGITASFSGVTSNPATLTVHYF